MQAVNVLCIKWGRKYGPEYVNRLYAMVARHLRGPFQFVCLTDRSDGIRPEVRCLPIPPLDLPPGSPERLSHLNHLQVLRHGQGRVREALQAMQRTLSTLVGCCHGDERPDCPILDDLAGHPLNAT